MEFRIPSVEEMVVMPPAEVERGAQELEVIRRKVVAALAMRALRVDQTSAYLADGHKNLAAWGRATNNWSPTETLQFTKLARAFKWLPQFAETALTGAIGVDFMHAVAKLASNPRVRQHLADGEPMRRGKHMPPRNCLVADGEWLGLRLGPKQHCMNLVGHVDEVRQREHAFLGGLAG